VPRVTGRVHAAPTPVPTSLPEKWRLAEVFEAGTAHHEHTPKPRL
jgi:hypothetical protein